MLHFNTAARTVSIVNADAGAPHSDRQTGRITCRSAWCDRACRWRRRPKPAGSWRRTRSPEPASRSMHRCRCAWPPAPPSCPSSSSRRRRARRAGARTGSGEATTGTTTAVGTRRRPACEIGQWEMLLQPLDHRWRQWRTERMSWWIIPASWSTCALLQLTQHSSRISFLRFFGNPKNVTLRFLKWHFKKRKNVIQVSESWLCSKTIRHTHTLY